MRRFYDESVCAPAALLPRSPFAMKPETVEKRGTANESAGALRYTRPSGFFFFFVRTCDTLLCSTNGTSGSLKSLLTLRSCRHPLQSVFHQGITVITPGYTGRALFLLFSHFRPERFPFGSSGGRFTASWKCAGYSRILQSTEWKKQKVVI